MSSNGAPVTAGARPGRRSCRAVPAPLVVAAACLAPAGPAPAQSLIAEKSFYVTDDVVETVEVIGDSVYVGGRFTHVGPYTGPLAAVSIQAGNTLPQFPEANDFIFAVEPDGHGGWLVGGDFTEIGGVPRNQVARLLPDLTVDRDWNPDADGRVRGFAVHDSTVYVHGYFLDIGGAARTRLAALDLVAGAATAWDPAPSGIVEDLAVDGDTLYVVGSFSTIAGQSRSMAAFDLTTGALTSFDPQITNDALTVAARNGTVYVGGRFTTAGGVTRNRLAAFDAATSAVTPWNPDASGSATVLDVALADSSLFAGGAFSTVGGEIHRSVVEVSLSTGAPLNRIGGTTGTVHKVMVHGDSLYFGGDFTTVNFLDHRYLSGFDLNTGAILDLPQPLDIVRALAAGGDTLFVGGEFGSAVGVDRSRLAAFHANTLELLPWAPDFSNIVWEVEGSPSGDTLYVAGRFLTVDGAAREHLVSFDRTTGAMTSFAPSVNTTGDVYAISVTDSLLYLGGTYSQVNGLFRADLASVDRVTGAVTSWDPGSSGFVNAIQAWNDTVYVGGTFSTLGDSSRSNLAAVDGQTGDVLGWGNAVTLMGTSEVESFFPLDHPSYPQGAMFVGGDFLNLGIGLRRGVAALHRDTGNTLYPFDARLQPSFETEVRDYALADGLLYLAGDFGGIFTTPSIGAGAVDVVTGAPSPWIIDAGKPNSIAVSDSMVFVGGNIFYVQGYRHTNLAAFRRDRTPPMPATALTATAGAVDKRIELAWNPSPSADVKDYLVYRTAVAGADTTGKQVGVTAATSLSDDTPAYQEWFYRVYARDQAHNVGAASNEDSAVSPQIVEPEPTVTTAVHQNPALSQYADVVVVSDSLLMQPPAVTMESPTDPGGSSVAMTAVPGAAAVYRGPWEFTDSGVHTVTTNVVTAGGSPFEFTRTFTATLMSPADGGEARSADGTVTLRVPAGGLRRDTFLLVEPVSADGASHVRIGPAGALRAEAVLEIAYDPALVADPANLAVGRVEEGVVHVLPGEVLPGRSVVRAAVDRLGEFTLLEDAAVAGEGGAPRALALHPGLPNPFRGSTTLRYDLPARGPVRLAIYDVTGRLVSELRNGPADAGRHSEKWSGTDARGTPVAAGVYFARVTAGAESRVLKIVRLR